MISIPQTLRTLLEDPTVSDICMNGHLSMSFDRGAGFENVSEVLFNGREEDYRQFVLEQLSLSGRTWDAKLPFVDTVFFQTHRAHLVFPPVSRNGICLSLRRLPRANSPDPVRGKARARNRWHESAFQFELLVESVENHESVLFCGATGSGKTTLFNDLLCFVAERERLIALEDTAEIEPAHPHFLSLLSRPSNPDGFGGVTLRDLVRQTLRMKPDRILVGECRGDEVLDLLLALNTGHRGTMATVHANSALDAMRRLELLALIASKGTIPAPLIRALIAKGIQKIVHLERRDSIRKINEIISIEGMERDVIVSRRVFPKDRGSVAGG
ncbi:MAG: Flp pilus assembly complex ATPase component TadA [Bdellovibrionales bacterium]|nr:Flp pilus assembly complex ATPase component TadA [Bdellovibrionales bacterium]